MLKSNPRPLRAIAPYRHIYALILTAIFLFNSYPASANKNTHLIRIDVTTVGAYGDGIHDDYAAIQAAIDSAALNGSEVYLPAGTYNISNTLLVPSGVSLVGDGRGKTATLTPNSGSLIRNTSTQLSVEITGHNAVLRDLVIYDTDNAGATGGVQIIADGIDVESIVLERILISGFTDGYGLKLIAQNGGGISYCSFYDLRVRHAETGILIEEDESSYVNSNSFYHGAISGGGFNYCLHVKGGNNNIFHGMVMEPYSSTNGHIVVEKGEITGIGIRIEGASQPVTTPLIEFQEGTHSSFLSGTYSGGLTVDNGDNTIEFRSGKSLGLQKVGQNIFINAQFNGVSENAIPFWEIGDPTVLVEAMPSEILAGYSVIKLTIPGGVTTYLRPSPTFLQATLDAPQYDHVNFGAYIKTDQFNLITTTCRAPAGLTTGLYHPGNSQWQLIGMTSAVSEVTSYDPKFYITNNSGNDAFVYITTPTLNFGMAPPSLEASSIHETGGIISRTLITGMATDTTVASGFMVLKKSANTFEINGTNTISRINHLGPDRFPRGTVITLLFNDAGTTVISGAYITLLSAYTSVANSSLTLVSDGDGTWRELDRNL